MTGLPHTIRTPRFRIRMPRTLRHTLGLEAKVHFGPSPAIVHCHLCGSAYAARANHYCPRLYGR